MKAGFLFQRTQALVWLVAVCVFGWDSQSIRAQSLTPEQIEKIEQELKNIASEVEGSRLSSRTSAVNAFQKAAASEKATLDFYFTCYKEVRYDRQDARASDFRDWREQNEERIKGRGNLPAMQLQLQYLVLTLRAAEGVSRKTLIPELEAFANTVISSLGALQEGVEPPAVTGGGGRNQGGNRGGQGGEDGLRRLKEGVNNTVFAQAFNLDKTLKVSSWSLTPGNIGSLYEQAVLPYFQEKEPEMLASAWDRRIKLESEYVAAVSTDNPTAVEIFKAETLPQLHFEKSRDLFQFSSQQQGALAIINLLKQHPDHPNAGDWLEEFRGLLSQASSPGGIPEPAPGGAQP